VQVEFWTADKSVGTAVAASLRKDLLAAGIGHGHYGDEYRFQTDDLNVGVLTSRESGESGTYATYYIGSTSNAPAKLSLPYTALNPV
jgi:hypothetical protein